MSSKSVKEALVTAMVVLITIGLTGCFWGPNPPGPSLSNDARLMSLTLSTGELSPEFSIETLSYTAEVENAVSTVTITPVAMHNGASVLVNGVPVSAGAAFQTVALVSGANTVVVTVIAEDQQSRRDYTITITRRPEPQGETIAVAGNWYGFDLEIGRYVVGIISETQWIHAMEDDTVVRDQDIEEFDNQSRTLIVSQEDGPQGRKYGKKVWDEPVPGVLEISRYTDRTTLDEARNTETVEYTLRFYDEPERVPPTLTLEGAPKLVLPIGGPLNDPGAVAVDWDAPEVTVYASVQPDLDAPGEYTLVYQFTDADGNPAEPLNRIVEVGSGIIIEVE